MRRIVVVVGAHPRSDLLGFVERAVRSEAELVLLSVGYPITKAQQRAVSEVLALTADSEAVFEAALIPDVESVASHLCPDDASWSSPGRTRAGA